jgi:hypothetical protein
MRNCTVPVAVPAPGEAADTVAVKVTVWPAVEGFGLVVTPVVVPARLTVTVAAADVLPRYAASPEYAAVNEWLPGVSVVIAELVADPFTSETAPPTAPPSTKNCTVPVGVPPADDETAAVNVTSWP